MLLIYMASYILRQKTYKEKKAQAAATIPTPTLIMWLGKVSLEDGNFPDQK